nr:reverse transcriptase domain-containing protein [Tanacetum cinerariifolium]
MRTRNFYFPNNSSVTIPRRRNKRRAPNVVEPELRTIVEVTPMADNRTIEELLQAPTEGDVPNDVIKLMMFPYSLDGAARVWYDKEPLNSILIWEDLEMLRACPHHGFTELTQIDTFYNGLNENDQDSLNAAAGENLLSKTTREALHIIENKSKVRYSRNKPNVSRMNTTSRENASKTDDRIDKLADQISTLVDIVFKKVVTPTTVKTVEESCVTCGGNHAYYNCDATNSNQSSVCATTGTYNQVAPQNRASNYMEPPSFTPVQNGQNMFNQNQGQGNNCNRGNNFHGNQSFQVPNQGFQNQPCQVPNNQVQQGFSNEFLSYKKANDQMMRNMQSQINSLKGEFKNGEMKAITTRSGVAYKGPSIPTNPSPKKVVERETKETTDKEQTNFQGKALRKSYESNEEVLQIFQDFHFNISFADALLLMPKFASTIKSLLANKDKLFELAKIPLNENCSVMLLKKLPEKLKDPDKFLIPCDFPRMDVCHTLAYLGASINLMPFSIWKNLSLPELTPTRMTLELADRSITRPKGVAEDVFVKVGKFHFPTDFVVVDFEADPRTMRYSSINDDLSVNQIDVIDIAREDYAQEMLGFSNNSSGGNPTSTSEPIISDSSPSLTPFKGSDFFRIDRGLSQG